MTEWCWVNSLVHFLYCWQLGRNSHQDKWRAQRSSKEKERESTRGTGCFSPTEGNASQDLAPGHHVPCAATGSSCVKVGKNSNPMKLNLKHLMLALNTAFEQLKMKIFFKFWFILDISTHMIYRRHACTKCAYTSINLYIFLLYTHGPQLFTFLAMPSASFSSFSFSLLHVRATHHTTSHYLESIHSRPLARAVRQWPNLRSVSFSSRHIQSFAVFKFISTK